MSKVSRRAFLGGAAGAAIGAKSIAQSAMEMATVPPVGALSEGRPEGIAGLRIREWTCGDCGAVHDRDVNAARNILRIGLDALAEGAAQ